MPLQGKDKVLAATASPDPIASLLGPSTTSFRDQLRANLQASRKTRIPHQRRQQAPVTGAGMGGGGSLLPQSNNPTAPPNGGVGNQQPPRRAAGGHFGDFFRGGSTFVSGRPEGRNPSRGGGMGSAENAEEMIRRAIRGGLF